MVLQKALVFLVVSVNSLDNTRRPLIVPSQSKLEITDIISRYHCEVVLDGGHRIQIKNNLECSKHAFPARLVRLKAAILLQHHLWQRKLKLQRTC